MTCMRMVGAAAIALIGLAGGAQAFTHHPSTPAERAQTKALNEQQLQLAQQENTGLAINANSTTAGASPAAAPSPPVEAAATNAPASDARSGP